MFANCGLTSELDVLEFDLEHRLPGHREILEGDVQQHLDHPHLGRREVAALDLGVEPPGATEETVHHAEHQLGIEHDTATCRAAVTPW